MCQYCGCRDLPLLRDYIAEHERVINHGGSAVRALDAGDHDLARREIAAMARELHSHWRGEENGLFTVLAGKEMFSGHIDPLIAEHRELGDLLATLDIDVAVDRGRFRQAFDDLYLHIAKEEDGLFPASLTTLDGDQWDAAIAAWHDAHPGRRMIDEAG